MGDDNMFQQQDEEPPPALYIAQHESQRGVPVTSQLLGTAQANGYDLLTTPITNEHFRSRVLAQLAQHVSRLQAAADPRAVPMLAIAPLLPQDSHLAIEESNSALIGVVSPWIDLGSPDPLIAHISRQVLNVEVAYAAFCGLSNVLLRGPLEGADVVQYSRAVLEALNLGPYVQLHLLMPMTGELEQEGIDGAHLSELARSSYLPGLDADHVDDEPALYTSWEVWNAIRSVCRYSVKLTVGMCDPFFCPARAA